MMLIFCIVIPDVYLGCVWETDNIVRLRYRGRVPPVATGKPVQKNRLAEWKELPLIMRLIHSCAIMG
ncbi:hypothetical protein FGS43_24200 [Salmonella enterica]|uniref:Uncharacterized protein n=1 Tax=Salmonella enterica TaxID=28901 RepID=A0A5U0HG20_SALER|nr:hypothetical protein [Salmonella enterica]ECC3903327.1 hypothetical protein [Salmonella enterica subsp. enterica]ECE0877044.1 hypothetical protein [Salmonella enterica subsp. enterica serovar Abaetetuba]ECR6166264.1 hypothetical protein [Salmonella enterica subsp. enterica serovar Muenchen]ECS4147908.1 hypothetical protein [Salmonella enterica subsp. enterica serovar Urbana]ECS7055163.1 hypothetical protein [Salmonella enterica subsp. enterica serovar Oranienburg]ECS7969136.1 hypothetical 